MNEPKNCQINLWNQLGWELDGDVLQAVLTRMAQHATQAERIEIYPQDNRDRSGMLHWIINIAYRGGGKLTIGVVQREPGAQVEFHT